MKNKFLKSGKHVLSIVVAFAVLAVSLFTVVPAININADAAVTATDTWDGTTVTPTETDADGNIIIKTAEELAWLALASTPDETKDKNYKVVDNAVFDLGGMTGITLTSTAGDVSTATATDKNWTSSAKTFAGKFDGNGVIIYNMYSYCSSGYSGLFPWLYMESTDKTSNFNNITIKASYIKGSHFSGAIIGYSDASGGGRTLNFTNCKVENCYINATHTNTACNRTGALLVGGALHSKVNIDGCLAVDNVIAATDIKGGFIGNTSAYAGNASISGSIAIGNLPYAVLIEGSTKTLQTKSTDPACYSDVYTDQEVDAKYTGITTVAADNMKGAAAMENMPNLDWTKMIAFDGEYPDFRANHTLSVQNGDATGHKIACSDCGKSMTEAHVLVENVTGSAQECSVCDYSVAITDKNTLLWDATTPQNFAESGIAGGGTEENPYIIKTPAQLWYIAQKAGADSAGKYYKVADNVGTFDMNNKDWGLADNGCYFQGNFDGNGVTITNFKVSSWNAALFPNVSGSVTIKNVKLSGASINATGQNGGGLIANINGGATTVVTISNCVVENITVEAKQAAGAIAATAGNGPTLTIDNCLIKNNTVTTLYTNTDVAYKNNGILGLGWKSGNYTLSNSIILGNEPTYWIGNFDNVYTDIQPATANAQIKTLTVAEMSGAAGLENMALDFAGVWFANAGTPELQKFHTLKGVADATDAYAGHTANCEDCGLEGVGLSDHVYDDAYTCTVCGFTCDHENDNYVTDSVTSNGDCVTDPYVEKSCDCGYTWTVTTGTASGHALTKTDAKAATCAEDGNIDYWTCSTCEKIFLSDDKTAAMDTAVTAEDVVLSATGAHVELTDDNGDLVYLMDESNHSTYCKVCQTKITTTVHDGEFEKDENGHSGKCTVCKYETAADASHEFGGDNACDICAWTCTEHVVTVGEVKIEGDCVTDKVTAQYCDRCKVTLDDKVDKAAGHTLVKTDENAADCTKDGNVVYWTCSACENIFLTDDTMAAMDTAVSAEDTVVAKLPHNYVGGEPTYKYDEVAHWFECEDCGKAEYAEHTLEVDTDCEGVYNWCEDADGNSCGYETFDYTYSSDDGSATVVADTNTFTKDVITDLIQITSETSDYAELEEIFKAAGHSNFTAYEFSPSEEMAEGGKAIMTINVPDIYGNNAAIYYVDTESGKLEKLETKIEELENEDEEKVVVAYAEITKTGVFAVAADEVVAGGNDGDNNANNNNTNNGNNNQTNDGSANNNGDISATSPATASETVAIAVAAVAALSAAVIVFARKLKKA